MQNNTDALLGESMNPSPSLPNPVPLYSKCLSCPDFVTACRGIDITSLSCATEKRAYHKAIKKEFGFLLRDIYPLVKNVIGKSTTDEYFGSGTGDYKWLTVTTIHNALLYLVAQKKGMPLCEHSCSSSSSEVRNQLAAADLKVAAAELKQAQAESECEDLRRRLSDSDGDHTTKLTELAAAKQGEIDWLKTEVRVWRRFACILLIVGLVILGTLMLSLLIHVV
jgi:hypothetical protein